MTVAHSSTTSTDTMRASGDDEPWLPKIPGPRQPSGLKPRPAPPKQRLTARPIAHDLDWNGHIPTAREAAGSYTRASLDTAIANQQQDEPRPYDRELLGFQYEGLAADAAFGGAA